MEARIVKIEKGVFMVEYRLSRWGSFITVDKIFKTKTKAEAYIREKLKF